ncbi:MAG: SH3 domain-containing protein [Nitrospinales bacterium]
MKIFFPLLGVLAVISLISCSALTKKRDRSAYFKEPAQEVSSTDLKAFREALKRQNSGRNSSSIKIWKKYVKAHPRSFEAFNNLGMAYYSNDQLDEAIQAFESGLALEPGSRKVQLNLRRALRFRITLARENLKYSQAITDLKKVATLVSRKKLEDIFQEIEKLQGKIFEQVKRVDTPAEYERFIKTYPHSAYVEEAKRRLAALNPQVSELSQVEPESELSQLEPEEDRLFFPPLEDGIITEEIVEEDVAPSAPPAPTALAAQEEETALESQSANLEPEQIVAAPAPAAPPPAKVRKVKVTTRSLALNVRVEPSLKAPVIAKAGKGTILRLLDERKGWYRVAFGTGQFGWISKKYAQELN